MTAPKIKMLAHNGGLPSGNYPAADLVRYIRADAPELLALVDAYRELLDMMDWNGTGSYDLGQMEKAQYTSKIKAYEAMK